MTDDIALILLPSVLYRSGQILDMERLTAEAHKRGIHIGFDLCHQSVLFRIISKNGMLISLFGVITNT